MVKFKKESDRLFLEEEAKKSGVSLEEQFLKRRKLEIGLTDWERRLNQKQNWREKRFKYLQGIRKFHRSTKGKEFHRRLGRFLATRDTSSKLAYYQGIQDKERFLESLRFDKVDEYREFLISVLSALTHALIEERYFEPDLDEAVRYKMFLGILLAEGVDVLKKVCEGRDNEIDFEFWEYICDLKRIEEGQID